MLLIKLLKLSNRYLFFFFLTLCLSTSLFAEQSVDIWNNSESDDKKKLKKNNQSNDSKIDLSKIKTQNQKEIQIFGPF